MLLQSSITDEKNWPLLGMAVLALAYVVIRPMLRRRTDPLEKPFSLKSLSQQRAVERSMQNLLVDLTEMARQISAQLDTRAAKLQALIDQADDRIRQLRDPHATPQSSDSTSHMRLVPGDSTAADTRAESSERPAIDPRHEQVYRLADEGSTACQIAARLNRPTGEVELILALRSADKASHINQL